MAIAAQEQPQTPSACALTPEHIARLALTFDQSLKPVWIHDLEGRCVYQNRAARKCAFNPTLRLELTDASGTVIAQIVTTT